MHIKHDSILSNQCFNNYRRLCFNNNLMCKCWCTKLLSLCAGIYVARKQWMNEWMNSMNVLFPDRLRYRECHWTSWLPAPLQGADFFACEWGNPDVSERVNRTTKIAQVFRYLLLSSIIMTAGASLHTSVNQHAQRHWCITPVVWQRHQDTHRSAIRPHRALAQTLKRNDTDTWEIGQKDTKQTELSMW